MERGKAKTKDSSFFFFFLSEKVLRSYTYQFYLCPTGSNFITWPLNECLYEYWRGRENAKGYHLAPSTREGAKKLVKPCRKAV